MKRLNDAQRLLIVQFIKFGMVGVVGFAVDASVLAFCMRVLGMGPYLGRLFSFLCGASSTWICNRHFTFRGQGKGPIGLQWVRFIGVSMGGFVFNYGTYAALIATVPLVRAHPTLGVASGSVAGMFFNFFAARRLVFR